VAARGARAAAGDVRHLFKRRRSHAKELLVNRRDQIKRGQIIAHSGQTGNVNAPQLHFKVRRGTPLDPIRFLKS
jgi:murein DD-endopeptidase MepM/ murein hydrolase activator NlpD